jgi:hypothetical protein
MVEQYAWKYKHFTPQEMECSCYRCKGKNTGYNMQADYMDKLEKARIYAGIPFYMTGFRCKEHNAETKGSSKTSEHPKGRAGDISFKNLKQCFLIVFGLIQAEFTRIKIYRRKNKTGWIHCDVSQSKNKPAVWLEVKEV